MRISQDLLRIVAVLQIVLFVCGCSETVAPPTPEGEPAGGPPASAEAPAGAPAEARLEVAAERTEPFLSRLLPVPGWEVTLTPSLLRIEEDIRRAAEVGAAPGTPYGQAMSRAHREARLGTSHVPVWWKVDLAPPEEADPHWPVAIEVDEARVIQGAWLDGKALGGFDRQTGRLLASGEGAVVLPVARGQLVIKALEYPHLYENGFGDLRLRPATLDEILHLESPAPNAEELVFRNSGPVSLTGTALMEFEDFFGVPIASTEVPLSIAPGESAKLPLEIPRDPDLHKLRVSVAVGDRQTSEHWHYFNAMTQLRERPGTVRSEGHKGWEYVFVKTPISEAPPPADGWKPLPRMPFVPDEKEYESHYLWAKRTLQVPADWAPENRILLFAPARYVRVNDTVLADLPFGDLAGPLLLPAGIGPGDTFTLYIGVTDYIDALVDPTRAPERGRMRPPARGVMGAIATTSEMGMSFDVTPELASVPATRVAATKIKTSVLPEKILSAEVELANSQNAPFAGTLALSIHKRGKPIYEAPPQKVTLAADGTTIAKLQHPWPDAKLWGPEHPHLYEFRVEILDGSGKVVDRFRERFGFREFGVQDDHFTLNGNRINLLGGSHIDINRLTWPLRGHPFRLHRANTPANSGNTFVGGTSRGLQAVRIADEAGYLLKMETGGVNAHHANTYAWERDELWDSIERRMLHSMNAARNNPSVMMWDVGNELNFRADGEDARMGEFLNKLMEIDPARLATVGGPAQQPVGSAMLNRHGSGSWNDRTDFLRYHPKSRPSYLRNTGTYIRPAEGEPAENWSLAAPGSATAINRQAPEGLLHLGNKPILFAEGHYYESQIPIALLGHDAYLSLPTTKETPGFERLMALHGLNMVATRSRSIQNVRQGGVPGSMIHVDRGIGRYALPLATFPWDRKTRFRSGEPISLKMGVHQDLAYHTGVQATFRLYDGATLLGEITKSWDDLPSGTIEIAELSFPAVKTHGTDLTLRLQSELRPKVGEGRFFDSIPIHVFHPDPLAIPEGIPIALFDPDKRLTDFFVTHGIETQSLAKLEDWDAATQPLLIAPQSLESVDPGDLASLSGKVNAGGQIIVLDHVNLPQILPVRLTQETLQSNYAARLDAPSVLTRGLLTPDLGAWQTEEGDQLVVVNPLQTPSTGNFLSHAVSSNQSSPLLEVGHGKGRILFSQLNLSGALGLDPAADRLMANLLRWPSSPSPFARERTLIVGSDASASTLRSRLGLVANATDAPQPEDLKDTTLIVVDGTDEASRNAVQEAAPVLSQWLNQGGTLMVRGFDKAAAAWLSALIGTPISFHEFPTNHAYLLDAGSPHTRGLGHADFFNAGKVASINPYAPVSSGDLTVTGTITGKDVLPLTQPAALVRVPHGEGTILIDAIQGFARPVPSQLRVLSMLLSNSGATLDFDQALGSADDVAWDSQPIDLTRFVNRPLADDDAPGAARGWHGVGPGDDMRHFPTGRQNLRGINYLITPPETANGNSVIALSGSSPTLPDLPTKIENIPVHAKAERIAFLQSAAWGVPGLTYRIWYKEDRAAWIPGQPDPFVDVQMRPREHYDDWVYAGQIESGSRFMPGGRVAWIGQTEQMKQSGRAPTVGVFEAVWDNPHPDKTIDTIDVFTREDVGSGHAFIFGISLLNRQAGTQTAKPELSKVAPGIAPANIETQVQFPNYGFVLAKDGTIPSIYDASGTPFAQTEGWVARGARTPPGGQQELRVLSRQANQRPEIRASGTPARRVFDITGRDPKLDWKATLTATAAGLRYEISYTPIAMPPEGFGGQFLMPLRFLNDYEVKTSPNELPVMVRKGDAAATVDFDRRYLLWMRNYSARGRSLEFFGPPRDAPPFAEAQNESLWWEISPP